MKTKSFSIKIWIKCKTSTKLETMCNLSLQIKFHQMKITKRESARSLISITSSKPFTALYLHLTANLIWLNPEKSNSAEALASFSKLKELKKNSSIKSFKKLLSSVSKTNGLNIKCNYVKMSLKLLSSQQVTLTKVSRRQCTCSGRSSMKIILTTHFFRNW